MSYILVEWRHTNANDPILLYSELDEQRWEMRKIEIFRDGRRGYASAMESFGETRLGELPVPTLIEIAYDAEFEPAEISKEEFENEWAKCKSQ